MLNLIEAFLTAAVFGTLLGLLALLLHLANLRAVAPEPLPFERCYTNSSANWICISRRGQQMCVRTSEEFFCTTPHHTNRRQA